MRKILIAGVLSLFLGVSVLFSGCGTDLSGVNSRIQQMQQQIDSLNQTILDLQNQLQDATGDISSLQSQLAIASANYDKLYNQVYGVDPSYKQINDTTSYSFNGIKLFDFTPTEALIGGAGAILHFNFTSNITSINNITDFGFGALLYTENNNLTYEIYNINNNSILFSENNFDYNTQNALIYLFVDSNIFAIYEISFV